LLRKVQEAWYNFEKALNWHILIFFDSKP
jgi:hypothetical protein